VNREIQGVLMLLVGGALLRASLTDLYLRYVKPGLQPLLIVAGVVLIVAAVTTLWYEYRRRRTQRAHEHGHRESRVAWLLLVPVLALILVAPPALGSYAANRSGTALLQRPPGFPALPAGDPVRLTVLDYATRAVFDDGRSLTGRQVRLTGFVSRDGVGPLYLTRMVVSCCAADAQPVKIGLSGQAPIDLKPDTWLDVTGTYSSHRTTDRVNGGTIPYLDVTAVTAIPAPREQYQS
jgi:uncharacterized repeat protein (TIGR03943 family)